MESFSKKVKAELCSLPPNKTCCAVAESFGALLFGNAFTGSRARIITGSRAYAERLPKLFGMAFSANPSITPDMGGPGRFGVALDSREDIAAAFRCFGLDADNHLTHHINLGVLEDSCCRVSFLRGAFLSGGSVTDPVKRYHLELVTDHMHVSRETRSILLDMDFSPKETARGGNYVTYFKHSEAIEDFLTTIGAPLSAMGVMEAKVEKDMINAVNRRVNCDTANADKIVAASLLQLEAIRRIERDTGLSNLPDKLKEAALLRIANPESSIAELAQLADPPVSKSCLSHRMKKLLDYGE